MNRPLVTLTSDFGEGSPYVAAMKGVLRCINANVDIVDITHAIRPQDIQHGALVLRQVVPYFPSGTIHVAVVDPGVGTPRAILYAEIAGRRFIAPDNGLLSWIGIEQPSPPLRAVTEPRFWLPKVSATFHGRDIMAPVAAHLSRGVAPEQIGPPVESMCRLPWPKVRSAPGILNGEVLTADSFGNLITNIAAGDLEGVPAASVEVEVDGHRTTGLFRTYAEVPQGTLLALLGSTDLLEIAIRGDNAAEVLCAGSGAAVHLSWQHACV